MQLGRNNVLIYSKRINSFLHNVKTLRVWILRYNRASGTHRRIEISRVTRFYSSRSSPHRKTILFIVRNEKVNGVWKASLGLRSRTAVYVAEIVLRFLRSVFLEEPTPRDARWDARCVQSRPLFPNFPYHHSHVVLVRVRGHVTRPLRFSRTL